MHLTREVLDVWAAAFSEVRSGKLDPRVVTLRLEEGDSMPAHRGVTAANVAPIAGPAIVDLVVYRDGGWSARQVTYETPESIALAASLAQREPPCTGYIYFDHHAELCRDQSHAHGDQTYLWQSQTLPVPPEHQQ